LPGALGQFGVLLAYVAFQAALNLYMKFTMSRVEVAPGLHGIPASFLVTGLQQLVAIGLFLMLLARRRAGLSSTPPRKRNLTGRERRLIILHAAAFAGNMSLNNFSLAFIPLSVNQVIRACTPVATAVVQAFSRSMQHISRLEWLFMLLGVACAATTVLARIEGNVAASGSFVFGALLCVLSVFFGATDLVLKQKMVSELGMSSKDATGYSALPSFLILLVPGLLWQHPLPEAWAEQLGSSSHGFTDFEVIARGCALRPALVGVIAVSGVLAFGYNTFTTFFAGRLSPTTTSIVGNLPASTLVSLLLLEQRLPGGAWGFLLWASIAGNVAAFAAYNSFRRRRLKLQS